MKKASFTYLIILFGTTVGLLAAVAAVNATLDPFGAGCMRTSEAVDTPLSAAALQNGMPSPTSSY